MSDVTIDASVWVAGSDPADLSFGACDALLTRVAADQISVHIPALAEVEVACALARKLRDSQRGRFLARTILSAARIHSFPMSDLLVSTAIQLGTEFFLRGADATYVAVARMTESDLITLDRELVARANARTPQAWLAAQP